MIRYLLLISRQGKPRYTRFCDDSTVEERQKIIQAVSREVLLRPLNSGLCLDGLGDLMGKVVYKRYASLYFICGIEEDDNELIMLEFIHNLVELLDRYFGNVCELDLIFNFYKVHMIVDEILINGEICETSKKACLRIVAAQDVIIDDALVNGAKENQNRRHKRRKHRESVWWATETFYKPSYLTRAIENGHHLHILDFIANRDISIVHVNSPDRTGRIPFHAALLAEDPFALGALMTVKPEEQVPASDLLPEFSSESAAQSPFIEPILHETPYMHCGIKFLGLPGLHVGLACPSSSSEIVCCYALLFYNRLTAAGEGDAQSKDEVDTLIREVRTDILDMLPAAINPAVYSTVDINVEDADGLTLLERCAERGDYLLCKLLIRAGAELRDSLARCGAASSMNTLNWSNTFNFLINEYRNQNLFDRACVMRVLRTCIKNLSWRCVAEILKYCELNTEEFESLANYADTLNVSNEWVALVDKSIDGGESMFHQLPTDVSGGSNSVAIFTHQGCLNHLPYEPCDFPVLSKMVNQHVENPHRLEVLLDKNNGILSQRLNPQTPSPLFGWQEETKLASWADIRRVHDAGYVSHLKASCHSSASHIGNNVDSEAANLPPQKIDSDTIVTSGSFDAALSAAQSVISAIKAVCVHKTYRNAFCCIRPPGHHVGTYGACQTYENQITERSAGSQGFCLLNNVAIGAAWARYNLSDYGIDKIAIVDIDIHHGNGTECIVRNLRSRTRRLAVSNDYILMCLQMDVHLGAGLSTKTEISMHVDNIWRDLSDWESVFFASIHGFDGSFYPGTGESSDGNLIHNVPIGEDLDRKEYMSRFYQHVIEPLTRFEPDLILVSAGFDAHVMDQVGGHKYGKLTELEFEKMTRALQQVANTYCKGRLVSVLEGGYNTILGQASPFARSVYTHVRSLATTFGHTLYNDEPLEEVSPHRSEQIEEDINMEDPAEPADQQPADGPNNIEENTIRLDPNGEGEPVIDKESED